LKVVVKIILVFLSIILVIIISLLILSWYFEDRIADYAIKELNQQIRTQVRADKVDFTILRKFPDASIRFKNTYVNSVRADYNANQFEGINTDTLLFAEEIYLQLSLIPLIRNQYVIREVQVNNGRLNIYTDSNGNNNYIFWKRNETKNKSNLNIDLQQVKISEINFLSLNLANKTRVSGAMNKSVLKGDFNSERYILDFILDGKLKKYTSNDKDYISNKNISIKSKLNVTGNNFNIIKSNLVVEGLDFIMDGNIVNDEITDLDLKISGRDLNLEDLYKSIDFIVPVKYRKSVKVKGNLNFNAEVKGLCGKMKIPAINAEFSLREGWARTTFSENKIENISLNGFFSNGAQHVPGSESLRLENVSLNFGDSKCSGNFNIKNFSHPVINYYINAELNLQDLLPFIKSKTLTWYSGKISINTKIQGSQEGLFKISNNDILNWKLDGNAELVDIKFGLKDKNISIEHLNANIDIGNYLKLNDLNLVISGNELSIKGRIDNWREYLLKDNSKLWMDLNMYSGNLIIDNFLHKGSFEKVTNDSSYIMPDWFYLKGKFWFDRFIWDKFSATNMLGDLKYQPGSLLFNGEFSTMGGDIKGNGFAEQKDDLDFSVRINSTLHQINIQTLFYCFNNFGQTFIQDKHLKGQLSGDVEYYSLFDKYLNVRKESILVETDIKIHNGELINFEPMLGLSDFIDVEELKHIRFSTLENQIFIRNSEVMIPQMDIFSSAINISGSGVHGFDNQFNYKVNVELSDLLLNKSHRREPAFEEHVINDDGLNRTKIYLKIVGTPDDYHINYDRKEAAGALKTKLSDEKAELKSVLKEEFGLFSKDTLPVKPVEDKKRDFFIKWDELNEEIPDSIRIKDQEKSDKFTIEWDDEKEPDTAINLNDNNKILK
jgi:hypothetical protein